MKETDIEMTMRIRFMMKRPKLFVKKAGYLKKIPFMIEENSTEKNTAGKLSAKSIRKGNSRVSLFSIENNLV